MELQHWFWLLFQSMVFGVGAGTIIHLVFTKGTPQDRFLPFIGGLCWMCAALSINSRIFP
jgi:hypothetical protein